MMIVVRTLDWRSLAAPPSDCFSFLRFINVSPGEASKLMVKSFMLRWDCIHGTVVEWLACLTLNLRVVSLHTGLTAVLCHRAKLFTRFLIVDSAVKTITSSCWGPTYDVLVSYPGRVTDSRPFSTTETRDTFQPYKPLGSGTDLA